MLTINSTLYESLFDSTMSFDETKAVFGQIPVAEYCLMLGMEQFRFTKNYSKKDMLQILFKTEPVISNGVARPNTATVSTDIPKSMCCGGGKIK